MRIVVNGPPPRKNARGTIGRSPSGVPIRITPKRLKMWRANLYAAIAEHLSGFSSSVYDYGAWRVEVDVYEARLRRLDIALPHGDIDSCVTAVLDAMQPRGGFGPSLIDDDARIVEVQLRKHYDKARPRVEITISEVTGG